MIIDPIKMHQDMKYKYNIHPCTYGKYMIHKESFISMDPTFLSPGSQQDFTIQKENIGRYIIIDIIYQLVFVPNYSIFKCRQKN